MNENLNRTTIFRRDERQTQQYRMEKNEGQTRLCACRHLIEIGNNKNA